MSSVDHLEDLIGQLERAAEQLRSGELSADAAATLELTSTLKPFNGGISSGLNVWNEHLTLNSPGHTSRIAARGCPDRFEARPRRLGHVLLFSGDLERMIDFYTRVLGMKLSDRCPGIIAFLRCTPDHHNVALLASKGPGFHHGSFEVGGVDEIAMGMQRAHDAGIPMGWGLGRHVIGSNFFYYVRDPWGSWAEYFHDLDHIPETCAWQPRDFAPEDALYRWGPPVPEDFGLNRELEG